MPDSPPTDEDVAAALAVIHLLLDTPDPAPPAHGDAWRASARLLAQGLVPGRMRVRPAWNNIERLRKGGNAGMPGVAGL